MKKFKTTAEIKIPEKLIDQIVGQDNAVDIVKKAAKQHRNVLLIGEPGIGKTLIAQAMAELLPATDLEDVLTYKNFNNENNPLIKTVKTYPNIPEAGKPLGDGQGRQILQKERLKGRADLGHTSNKMVPAIILIVIILFGLSISGIFKGYEIVVLAALILGVLIFGSMALFIGGLTKRAGVLPGMFDTNEPKLIVDNTGMTHAPFVDATGSRAGALFGDVKHDPLQCILPGEKIILGNGNLVPISKVVDPYFAEGTSGEVELGGTNPFKVLGGFDNEFKLRPVSVVRVYRHMYSGKILTIKTRSGSQIRVTPNHPMALLGSNGKVEYSEARNMIVGGRLIIPERITTGVGKAISDATLVFIADLLADGYIGKRHIEFNFKRQFKIDQIKADIERLGYIPKIKIRSDGATQIAINSAALCKELRNLGVMDGKEKRIPDVIFSQPTDKKNLFLFRLMSLDGYVNKQGQYEILSSSKTYIQQIRALFFTIGLNPKYHTRTDRGYGKEKGTIQHMLRWNSFEFSQYYHLGTINPMHVNNLDVYLADTGFSKECFDDIVPLNFSLLDSIRLGLGVSKEKIHQDFWSLNPRRDNTQLTRNLLNKINSRFAELGASTEDLIHLNALGTGDYAFDEIDNICEEQYEGFVYNLTTESGNYLVDFVLTHNSGGLGTPPHLRVESGAIHRANKGVLFIDEIANLEPRSQQELLTSMQEKKYPITGQSEMSSGALVRTQPVPTDFILVAAGNMQDMQNMHPALRSRIRGYGYEVYMDSSMRDTAENRDKLIQVIAQEVAKDGKIPHFDYDACMEIIEESRRRSGRKNRLTLVIRDLGGLIRAAGDIATEHGRKVVTREDVIAAKKLARPLEAQFVDYALEYRKDYKVFSTKNFAIGRVNGLAVLGSSYLSSGIIIPIVAEITPASSRAEGKIIATGKLGKIAQEAVKNISAVIKRHMGRDISSYDIHIQFLQTYEGVEGDSASISVAVSVISALEGIPVDQSIAMTGSLSVRGDVLPVGGVTGKIEAAIDAGLQTVVIPQSNKDDIYIDKERLRKIKIVPVRNIADVLEHTLKKSSRRDAIIRELRHYITTDNKEREPLVVERKDQES